MFLSQQGKQIPKCFYHDPLLQNKEERGSMEIHRSIEDIEKEETEVYC